MVVVWGTEIIVAEVPRPEDGQSACASTLLRFTSHRFFTARVDGTAVEEVEATVADKATSIFFSSVTAGRVRLGRFRKQLTEVFGLVFLGLVPVGGLR
jgi:hypothetical protein